MGRRSMEGDSMEGDSMERRSMEGDSMERRPIGKDSGTISFYTIFLPLLRLPW